MDYVTGLAHAVDYIEEHITEPLDSSRIAREAACSDFYFQRIFGILCGITLGEYIRARRLTLAGNELALGAKVLDTALKYGWDSPESFTRAFARFHGISPSQAKKGSVLKSFSRVSVQITLKGGNIMNYKIKEEKEFKVLEKVYPQSTDNGINKKTIPESWMKAHQDGTSCLLTANALCDDVYGICYGNPEPGAKTFDYSIAVKCADDCKAPDGFRVNTIPARTWAEFECVGAIPEAIQTLWHDIYAEFFPTSGYKPTCEMDIEIYPKGNNCSPEYKSFIRVAVEKK